MGYNASAYRDYAVYPSTSSVTKRVSFDIENAVHDAMERIGILINFGEDTNGYVHGYILTLDFPYRGSTGDLALFKINDNTTKSDFNNAAGAIGTYATKVCSYNISSTITAASATKKFHLDMSFNDDSLEVTVAPYTSASVLGTSTTVSTTGAGGSAVFEDAGSGLTYGSTGSYAFGPICQYASHGCNTPTLFKFLNIKMAYQANVFSALGSADYGSSQNIEKYFINLVNEETKLPQAADFDTVEDYNEALESYWNGIARLRSEEIFYVTNQATDLLGATASDTLADGTIMKPSDYSSYDAYIKALGDWIWNNGMKRTYGAQKEIETSKPTAAFNIIGSEIVNEQTIEAPISKIEKQLLTDRTLDLYFESKSKTNKDNVALKTITISIQTPDVSTPVKVTRDYAERIQYGSLSASSPAGTYEYTFTVTDVNGNVSDSVKKSFVIVEDTVSPDIQFAGADVSVADLGKGSYDSAKDKIVFALSDNRNESDWGVKAYQLLEAGVGDAIDYTVPANFDSVVNRRTRAVTTTFAQAEQTFDATASTYRLEVPIKDLADTTNTLYLRVWDLVGNENIYKVVIMPRNITDSLKSLKDYRDIYDDPAVNDRNQNNIDDTAEADQTGIRDSVNAAKAALKAYADSGNAVTADTVANYDYLLQAEKELAKLNVTDVYHSFVTTYPEAKSELDTILDAYNKAGGTVESCTAESAVENCPNTASKKMAAAVAAKMTDNDKVKNVVEKLPSTLTGDEVIAITNMLIEAENATSAVEKDGNLTTAQKNELIASIEANVAKMVNTQTGAVTDTADIVADSVLAQEKIKAKAALVEAHQKYQAEQAKADAVYNAIKDGFSLIDSSADSSGVTANTLKAEKELAKGIVTVAFKEYSQSDFTPENWARLETIADNALTQQTSADLIDAQTSAENVMNKAKFAVNEMAKVSAGNAMDKMQSNATAEIDARQDLTIEQKEAIKKKLTDSMKEIADKLSANEETNPEILKKAIELAKAQSDKMQEVADNAADAVAAVNQDASLSASEKQQLIDNIYASVDTANNAIAAVVPGTAELTGIDEDLNGVDDAFDALVDEASKLVEAQIKAKKEAVEMHSSIEAGLVNSETNKILADGFTDIDSGNTVAAVEAEGLAVVKKLAKETVKNAFDKYAADTTVSAEERAAIKAVKDAAVADNGALAIEICTTKETVVTAMNTAMDKMAQIKKNAVAVQLDTELKDKMDALDNNAALTADQKKKLKEELTALYENLKKDLSENPTGDNEVLNRMIELNQDKIDKFDEVLKSAQETLKEINQNSAVPDANKKILADSVLSDVSAAKDILNELSASDMTGKDTNQNGIDDSVDQAVKLISAKLEIKKELAGNIADYDQQYIDKDVTKKLADAFKNIDSVKADSTTDIDQAVKMVQNAGLLGEKDMAKEVVENAFAGYQQADYSEESWNKIIAAKDAAVKNAGTIDSALNAVEIVKAVQDAVKAMQNVFTAAEDLGVSDFISQYLTREDGSVITRVASLKDQNKIIAGETAWTLLNTRTQDYINHFLAENGGELTYPELLQYTAENPIPTGDAMHMLPYACTLLLAGWGIFAAARRKKTVLK